MAASTLPCHFLSLPLELRVLIYGYALDDEPTANTITAAEVDQFDHRGQYHNKPYTVEDRYKSSTRSGLPLGYRPFIDNKHIGDILSSQYIYTDSRPYDYWLVRPADNKSAASLRLTTAQSLARTCHAVRDDLAVHYAWYPSPGRTLYVTFPAGLIALQTECPHLLHTASRVIVTGSCYGTPPLPRSMPAETQFVHEWQRKVLPPTGTCRGQKPPSNNELGGATKKNTSPTNNTRTVSMTSTTSSSSEGGGGISTAATTPTSTCPPSPQSSTTTEESEESLTVERLYAIERHQIIKSMDAANAALLSLIRTFLPITTRSTLHNDRAQRLADDPSRPARRSLELRVFYPADEYFTERHDDVFLCTDVDDALSSRCWPGTSVPIPTRRAREFRRGRPAYSEIWSDQRSPVKVALKESGRARPCAMEIYRSREYGAGVALRWDVKGRDEADDEGQTTSVQAGCHAADVSATWKKWGDDDDPYSDIDAWLEARDTLADTSGA